MLSRRAFIKGMGALALLPLIPAMLTIGDERAIGNVNTGYMTASDIIRARAEMLEHMKIQWANYGTMTIPIVEDGERTDYKVRYTVTEDGTESEIVEPSE